MPLTKLEAREANRRRQARDRAAKRKGRPTPLVRVSSESIYLPGQLAFLIGGEGDAAGGCVRVRSQQTRGEYFIPKSFLEPA